MKPIHLVFGLSSILLLAGCSPAKKTQSDTTPATLEYRKKLKTLYQNYLNADRDGARQNLQESLKLVETIKSYPVLYAESLHLLYSRLYVLEAKVGDARIADGYFDQAFKWRIEMSKLGNMDPADIDVAKREFTRDRCTEFVLSWDRKQHEGKDPVYLQGKTSQ